MRPHQVEKREGWRRLSRPAERIEKGGDTFGGVAVHPCGDPMGRMLDHVMRPDDSGHGQCVLA